MTEVVVARKIAELRARIRRVRELLPEDASTFCAGGTTTEALLFNLYLALQASTDLALHVVADRGDGVPGDARAALRMLQAAGVLAPELVARLSAAVGLRNRIAHQYASVDLGLVYTAAREGLGDLDELAGAIARVYHLGE